MAERAETEQEQEFGPLAQAINLLDEMRWSEHDGDSPPKRADGSDLSRLEILMDEVCVGVSRLRSERDRLVKAVEDAEERTRDRDCGTCAFIHRKLREALEAVEGGGVEEGFSMDDPWECPVCEGVFPGELAERTAAKGGIPCPLCEARARASGGTEIEVYLRDYLDALSEYRNITNPGREGSGFAEASQRVCDLEDRLRELVGKEVEITGNDDTSEHTPEELVDVVPGKPADTVLEDMMEKPATPQDDGPEGEVGAEGGDPLEVAGALRDYLEEEGDITSRAMACSIVDLLLRDRPDGEGEPDGFKWRRVDGSAPGDWHYVPVEKLPVLAAEGDKRYKVEPLYTRRLRRRGGDTGLPTLYVCKCGVIEAGGVRHRCDAGGGTIVNPEDDEYAEVLRERLRDAPSEGAPTVSDVEDVMHPDFPENVRSEERPRGNKDLRDQIEDALRDYRTHHLRYEGDGGGMQLIDALSPDGGSVRPGKEEIELLADEIAYRLVEEHPGERLVEGDQTDYFDSDCVCGHELGLHPHDEGCEVCNCTAYRERPGGSGEGPIISSGRLRRLARSHLSDDNGAVASVLDDAADEIDRLRRSTPDGEARP